jgi:hypothetical protein
MSTAGDTRFFAGASSLANSGSGVFNVKSTGEITGSDVLFTGGKIASFNLTNDAFYTSNFFISSSATGNDYFISSSNFNIKASGDITGSSALFDGSIYVTGTGTIGGFSLLADEIKSSNDYLRLKSSGQITGSNVQFTGGDIGGWTIDSGSLYNDSETTNIYLSSENTN